jgi:glycosyltransferase involved in cell wall biosynthesis
MRLLFVKPEQAWPRVRGTDVHCYYMMRTVAEFGHEVSLATAAPVKPEAVAGLVLAHCRSLDRGLDETAGLPLLRLTALQNRFASYWGIDHGQIRAVAALARAWRADAVIGDSVCSLPFLAGVEGACRVWFAPDEWAWHHLSQVRLTDPGSWSHLLLAAVEGLYERAYAPLLDRVWVVSEADRRAMRRVTGHRSIDVLPYGVDGDYYRPVPGEELDNSCVFWGRLDYGPNVQALQWFCAKVWPRLRREAPGARLTIYGFKPTDPVRALAAGEGIGLVPDLPDIRAGIARHQVVVLPFVSGGGVKNKLLEAFGMGRAVVGSPRARNGLFGGPSPPVVLARSPRQWVRSILALWADPARRKELGGTARGWVLKYHTWEAAARVALAGIEESLRGRPRRR